MLLYCLGQEADDVLISTIITEVEHKKFDDVLTKFDTYFTIMYRQNLTRANINISILALQEPILALHFLFLLRYKWVPLICACPIHKTVRTHPFSLYLICKQLHPQVCGPWVSCLQIRYKPHGCGYCGTTITCVPCCVHHIYMYDNARP